MREADEGRGELPPWRQTSHHAISLEDLAEMGSAASRRQSRPRNLHILVEAGSEGWRASDGRVGSELCLSRQHG